MESSSKKHDTSCLSFPPDSSSEKLADAPHRLRFSSLIPVKNPAQQVMILFDNSNGTRFRRFSTQWKQVFHGVENASSHPDTAPPDRRAGRVQGVRKDNSSNCPGTRAARRSADRPFAGNGFRARLQITQMRPKQGARREGAVWETSRVLWKALKSVAVPKGVGVGVNVDALSVR